jgi:CRISP-associated protein Cas1
VLRAATARAVVAAGLHPTLGVHHSNEGNAMRLVDDLMEPFRPCIDRVVWQCKHAGTVELTPDVKKQLVQALYTDLPTDSGNTPVLVCLQKLATSLALLYLGERQDLDLPLPALAPAWLDNDEDD